MAVAEKSVSVVSYALTKDAVARLKLVADVAAKRLPVACTSVVLSSINGVLVAEATGLQMYARVEVADYGDESSGFVKVAIPSKTIKALKVGQTLSIEPGRYSVNGLSGRSDDVESFPRFPEIGATSYELDVSAQYFADLASVASHASESEVRPILMAVNHAGNTIQATDALRLLKAETSESFPAPINVPASHAKTLSKLFGTSGARMAYDDHYTRYDASGVRAYVRQIDGTYPDTARIWPSSFNHEGTIKDANAWIGALVIAAKVADNGKNRDPNALTLNVKRDGVEVYTKSAIGDEYRQTLPYVGNGETSINVDARYLLDALREIGDGAILRIVNAKTPITLSNDSGRSALVALVG